jgi:tetratricopeptide (TPR) repeat protein
MTELRFRWLNVLKDYWMMLTFVLTIAVSGVSSLFYFAVFEVNPFDKPYEVNIRIKHTRLHNQIGRTLLLQGHYEQARQEFSKALEFRPYDKDGLNGRLFCELFSGLRAIEWTPAASNIVMREIDQLEFATDAAMLAVRQKYLGDLHARLGGQANVDKAISYYQAALQLNPYYADALFTYGWLTYDLGQIEQMHTLFKRMAEQEHLDYRAFHGYGYAQYMLALREENPTRRQELLQEAAQQSAQAVNLQLNHINIVADLGEVARCINPSYAVFYHKLAQQLLDDPKLSQLPENQAVLGIRLLLGEGYYQARTLQQKRAFVKYHLALDYLASYGLSEAEDALNKHKALLEEAKKLDEDAALLPIYEDGVNVIQRFLDKG